MSAQHGDEVAPKSVASTKRTSPGPLAEIPDPVEGAPAIGEIVPSHYRWCLGCGVDHPGGLHLRVVAGDELTMHSEFTISHFHQGAPGLAHGGLITTAMDESMGVLLRFLGQPAVTARLETDFRRPVPVGAVLHITTRITGVEGRKVFTAGSAHINSPDGPIAVQSAAMFIKVSIEHFLTHGNADDVAAAIEERRQGAPHWGSEVNP